MINELRFFGGKMLITAETKVLDALKEYPELKDVLIKLNAKFSRLNNKLVLNTVGRWARFRDVAAMGGLSICEVLHVVNSATGQADELGKRFPECIMGDTTTEDDRTMPEWFAGMQLLMTRDVRKNDDFFLPEIEKEIKTMAPGKGIEVINDFDPVPLKNLVAAMGLNHYTREDGAEEFHVFIFKPLGFNLPEKCKKDVLDVRGMGAQTMAVVMAKAQALKEGRGFCLLQSFKPDPMIMMLDSMGIKSDLIELTDSTCHMWFYKPVEEAANVISNDDRRVGVVMQSATPALWPVILRMNQSERLNERLRFDEVKVWDKTEKHLGWLVRGKADITFSAVAAVAKLFATDRALTMASVDVWDNFYILNRDCSVKKMEDLIGKTLNMPLIKAAPPASVTNYLLKAIGIDPGRVDFAFGNPFGRPEDLQKGFVDGSFKTVLLRQPEASYALEAVGNDACVLAFSDLWQKLHPGMGDLPNAGLVFKQAFVDEHPKEAALFQEELAAAIEWINQNPEEAADMSYETMGHTKAEVLSFLKNIHLKHVPAAQSKAAVIEYLKVLESEGSMKISGGVEKAFGLMG